MNLEETLNDLMNNVKISMIQKGGDSNPFDFDNLKKIFLILLKRQ